MPRGSLNPCLFESAKGNQSCPDTLPGIESTSLAGVTLLWVSSAPRGKDCAPRRNQGGRTAGVIVTVYGASARRLGPPSPWPPWQG